MTVKEPEASAVIVRWRDLPVDIRLVPGEVHLWKFTQNRPEEDLGEFFGWLSTGEQHRAQAYRFPVDRQHFITRHGLLRLILGCYTGLHPSKLKFTLSPFGKPFLTSKSGASSNSSRLQFNLSSSSNLAVLAVCLDYQLGVNVEIMQDGPNYDELVNRFFSHAEKEQWRFITPLDKKLVFYQTWTRKEAYLKAFGRGLSIPLDSFDVLLSPREPARLLTVRGLAGAAEDWRMFQLQHVSNYAAAVVVKDPGFNPRFIYYLEESSGRSS